MGFQGAADARQQRGRGSPRPGAVEKIEDAIDRANTGDRLKSHLLHGVAGLGKTTFARYLACKHVRQGRLVICIGAGVRAVRKRVEKRKSSENLFESGSDDVDERRIDGGERWIDVGDGVEMCEVGKKKIAKLSDAEEEAINVKLRRIASESETVVVLHDIDDLFDPLTDLEGPTFMNFPHVELSEKLHLCLLLSSPNQDRFKKLLYKTVHEREHFMKPYEADAMAALLGADAQGDEFKAVFNVLGGIPRRWIKPAEWADNVEEDCNTTRDNDEAKRRESEAKVKNFVSSARDVNGSGRRGPIIRAAYTGDGKARAVIQNPATAGLVMGHLEFEDYKEVMYAERGKKWKAAFETWWAAAKMVVGENEGDGEDKWPIEWLKFLNRYSRVAARR